MLTRFNYVLAVTRKMMKAPPGPKPAHFGPDVDWNEEKRRWTLPSKAPNKSPSKAPNKASSKVPKKAPSKVPKKAPKSGLMSLAVNGTVGQAKFNDLVDSLLKTFDPHSSSSYVNSRRK